MATGFSRNRRIVFFLRDSRKLLGKSRGERVLSSYQLRGEDEHEFGEAVAGRCPDGV